MSSGTCLGLLAKNRRVRISNISTYPVEVVDLSEENTSQVWFRYGQLPISSSEYADLFDNKKFDDLVHVLYSSDVAFSKIRITNARADGMDVDISKRVSVVDSTFERIGNDAIDSMTSALSIRNSYLSWCGDKGVSVGENSM